MNSLGQIKQDLQNEYSRLQARLEHMTEEKKDFVTRLRKEEQLTTQLATENDTIGDYITLCVSVPRNF